MYLVFIRRPLNSFRRRSSCLCCCVLRNTCGVCRPLVNPFVRWLSSRHTPGRARAHRETTDPKGRVDSEPRWTSLPHPGHEKPTGGRLRWRLPVFGRLPRAAPAVPQPGGQREIRLLHPRHGHLPPLAQALHRAVWGRPAPTRGSGGSPLLRQPGARNVSRILLVGLYCCGRPLLVSILYFESVEPVTWVGYFLWVFTTYGHPLLVSILYFESLEPVTWVGYFLWVFTAVDVHYSGAYTVSTARSL